MNLYGYANGDPVNYSDPFGLYADRQGEGSAEDENMDDDDDPCKRDAASQACKKFEEADALAAELQAVCQGDLKELAASLAAAGLGVGVVEGARLYRTIQLGRGLPSSGSAVGAAAAGPFAAMETLGAGGTTYNNAAISRAKVILGFIPGAAPAMEAMEAANSCRDARVWRARANGMR
jgi:hypothetical protein